MSLLGSIAGLTGSIVGGIVGGIIGSAIPGVGTTLGAALGASIGGMIGGIAGQQFWPEEVNQQHPQPPQPYESRIQISTWGESIPIQYDRGRLAGNIIYMQDIQKDVDRSRHRNNGVRYYEMEVTYSATFAIAFCEGPVEGVSRIWVNQKIFADYRDPDGEYYPSGTPEGISTANLETTIARAATSFTIHLGAEDQTADATLSALIGAADTPTYRGICYIVFINFPIGEFSGIPQIEVEIGPQVATDTCSHYFDGTGSGLDTNFWSGPNTGVYTRSSGVAILQHVEAMPDWQTIGDVWTIFEFYGDFDVQIDWSIANVSTLTGGWLDLYCGGESGYVGLYFGSQTTEGDGVEIFTSTSSYDDDSYFTDDRNGKFRLTKISGTLRGYVWNSSSSQWEWKGDAGGRILATGYTSSYYIFLESYVYVDSSPSESAIISIDNFITNSGCSETTWP